MPFNISWSFTFPTRYTNGSRTTTTETQILLAHFHSSRHYDRHRAPVIRVCPVRCKRLRTNDDFLESLAGKSLRNRTVYCAMLHIQLALLLLRRLVSRLTVNQLSDFFFFASLDFLRRNFSITEQLFHLFLLQGRAMPSKTHRNKAKLLFAFLFSRTASLCFESHGKHSKTIKTSTFGDETRTKLIITEKLKKHSKISLSSRVSSWPNCRFSARWRQNLFERNFWCSRGACSLVTDLLPASERAVAAKSMETSTQTSISPETLAFRLFCAHWKSSLSSFVLKFFTRIFYFWTSHDGVGSPKPKKKRRNHRRISLMEYIQDDPSYDISFRRNERKLLKNFRTVNNSGPTRQSCTVFINTRSLRLERCKENNRSILSYLSAVEIVYLPRFARCASEKKRKRNNFNKSQLLRTNFCFSCLETFFCVLGHGLCQCQILAP